MMADSSRLLHATAQCAFGNAESGNELRRIQQKDSFVADAAFSPDDRQIIVAGGDDRAYIWQVQAEAEPVILGDHSGAVQSASVQQ